jgi:hypothetical protein
MFVVCTEVDLTADAAEATVADEMGVGEDVSCGSNVELMTDERRLKVHVRMTSMSVAHMCNVQHKFIYIY